MKADVVIVGGGPAGAACAMYLAREGIPSVIVEREAFPRFHIGESMTGECGGVVRDLGFEKEMLGRRHPVKHGVKVYGVDGKHHWFLPVMQRTPEDRLKDQITWQVRRSDFDKMMLDEAVARGATPVPGRATKALVADDGAVRGVEVQTDDGGTLQIHCELVLDCSGQATFLANQGVTGPKYLGAYDKQIALFSQVAGAVRDDGGEQRENQPDNTLIFYQKKYHWTWFIPLDDEITSVGIVVPSAYFLGKKESKKDFVLRELRELHPEMARRMPGDLQLAEDVHSVPNYSYQVKGFCGKGYICVGDSHRFLDPIFSFGLYVALKEAQFVAPIVREYLSGTRRRDNGNPFADYQVFAEKGIDVLEDAMDLFWEQPFAFSVFAYKRYREDLIDVFAGRIYDKQPSKGITSFRKMLKRERDYENEDLYSVPIGSRYHPERAPLWEPTGTLESTEEWMGAR